VSRRTGISHRAGFRSHRTRRVSPARGRRRVPAAALSDLRVEIVTDGGGAEALASQWDGLVDRSGSTAWVTPAWMLGWWCTYRPSARLRIVAVYESDELVAVGPFCEVGPPGLRLVRFLGQVHQPNRIVTAQGREASAGVVWDALRRRGTALDLYDIEDSAGSGYSHLMEDPRWSVFDEQGDTCSRIVIRDSADDYLMGRASLVRDMERIRRKMERDSHVIDVVEADTPAEIDALLPAMAVIAAIAQRDRYKPGELEQLAEGSMPGTIAAMVQAGRVHVTLVRIGGRPVAFSIDLLGGRSVHGHLMAYDSEWGPYAPGIRCMEEAFRWTVRRGAAVFDLGVGVDGYKRRWSRDEYHTRRVVAAPSPAELALARAGMTLRAGVIGVRNRGRGAVAQDE
jgi:CelD/BcsL family acetyltransferase involved in cellulose biosynthesis